MDFDIPEPLVDACLVNGELCGMLLGCAVVLVLGVLLFMPSGSDNTDGEE